MSVNDKEHLILSDLSYLDFEDGDSESNLYELFYKERYKSRKEELLGNEEEIKKRLDNGENFFGDALKKWKVIDTFENDKTGLYGVVFKNSSGEVVVSYRGTESDTDKTKDLLYTDGKIASGVIPEQFRDGYRFYQRVRKKESGSDITVTGHSLGGGIAQYVAAIADEEGVTWNGVGIAEMAKINGNEFLVNDIKFDKEEISKEDGLSTSLRVLINNKEKFLEEMKESHCVDEEGNLLIDINNKVGQDKLLNVFKECSTDLLSKYFSEEEVKVFLDNYIEENRDELLAQFKLKDKLNDAIDGREQITNNVNSKDMVGTILDHIGEYYETDTGKTHTNGNTEMVDTLKDVEILDTFRKIYGEDSLIVDVFTKVFKEGSYDNYHGLNMFYPFVGENGERHKNLNKNYLHAVLRKFVDDYVSDDVIDTWYSKDTKLSKIKEQLENKFEEHYKENKDGFKLGYVIKNEINNLKAEDIDKALFSYFDKRLEDYDDHKNIINGAEDYKKNIYDVLLYKDDEKEKNKNKTITMDLKEATDRKIIGSSENEKIWTGKGNDIVAGGKGTDIIKAGAGNDYIYGGQIDIESLKGNLKRDESFIKDKLYGGKGEDKLIARNDSYLKGGSGYDTYNIKGVKYSEIDDDGGKIIGISEGTYVETDVDSGVYEKGSNKITESGLFIGDGFRIELDGFKSGMYGIDLKPKEGKKEEKKKGLKREELQKPDGLEDYEEVIANQDTFWNSLILDLNGDGIKTVGQENGVHFDLDNNDFKEKTEWINSKDGLLTLDKNNNGIIDDGNELFGTETESGFEILGEYDSNSDNKIDQNDEIYSRLKVWQDKNQNGESEAQELYTLKELDIKSIGLDHKEISKVEENGNIIRNKGNYENINGELNQVKEFFLARDVINTEESKVIGEIEEIKGLPELRGYGNVRSLRQAMLKDDKLIEYVEEFRAEKDSQKRQEIMDKILFTWTESEDIDPDSRAGRFDARKLNVLESFFGTEFNGVRGKNPIHNVISTLETSYDKLSGMLYSGLMLGTHLKEVNQNIIVSETDNGETYYDFSKVSNVFSKYVKDDRKYAKSLLNEFTKVINSYDLENKSNTLKFYEDIYEIDNTLLKGNFHFEVGNENNNELNGDNNDEILIGFKENDSISGNNGDDILVGGKGSDYLEGGMGSDIYEFSKGFGRDTVKDYASKGYLWFKEYDQGTDKINLTDLSYEDLYFKRQSDDLVINSINNKEDQIKVDSWFDGDDHKVEELYTSDNKKITDHQIEQLVQEMAAFETDSGITWTQAIKDEKEEALDILATHYSNANLEMNK
ncbi:DUF2974 domain-containing protein [Sporohalobacter salinus]|uniref:DUF2974 domain-containing protein n=1 Tax=Sporohalobacter salinus TaxID=1494606 RepID=UPI00196161F9|nr:DUF2974 domain-containing protein [Sporohalobacter salinus]MBM7625088.1 Ca2+-binding RTX toxin-like protein [Sporohalobacter salinus]